MQKVKTVITDSRGSTEETAIMDIPCMTLGEKSAGPETIKEVTNEILGTDPKFINPAMAKLIAGN